MNKNSKHITHLIENSLCDVINEAKGSQTCSGKDDEIHFERMVYSKEHNLVVVEIGQEQLLDLPESFFEGNVIKQALLARSNCSKVGTMDLGRNTYIYYWLTPKEQDEKTGEANLAYSI